MNMKTLILGGLAGLLAGCVSVLPEPDAPEALYSIDADADFQGLRHDIIVREPEAPRLVAGQNLISEGPDGGLRVVPGVEWSGSATRQMQLAMVNSFRTGEAGHAVLPELGVIAGFELATQLSVLRLRGDTGVCEMTVSVLSTRDRSLLARIEIASREQASSNSAGARALALKAAAMGCISGASQFAIQTLDEVS